MAHKLNRKYSLTVVAPFIDSSIWIVTIVLLALTVWMYFKIT